ncbi:esterase FE4-like [Belonocnema kinseyi]|uniref:esterase FE4-like n=1 Tax=Belonocnema kinseyi TaxID=2817044 RepID=UPI00143D5EC5|nr:esterase FE4-like [Belonocnema kinseyi]
MTQQTRNGRKFSSFLGIPYAEPPIKDLRFKSPLPAKLWNGVRMANVDGNECPQMRGTEIVGSEDCLYLNVFTPNVFKAHYLLPVMVWIHGGAFVGGSSNSSKYNPGYLLNKDIVLVTLNYRLGIFGFLSTGNRAAPGNFGLKDQVLALNWVQRNIKAFGGDPNRVTLFAQSAGAASVSLHALSNASTSFFHQYITQSGSSLDPWAYQKRSYFEPFVHQLAFLVGCPAIFSETLVECLRTKKVDQLLSTSSVFGTIARFAQLTWTPTDEPESEDAFLTDSPENLIAKNKVKDCPFITGNVVNEGFFITELMYSNKRIYDTVRFGLDLVLNYISSYYLKPRNN